LIECEIDETENRVDPIREIPLMLQYAR